MFLKEQQLQFVVCQLQHLYSMVHRLVLTTKSQDELLSHVINHENKQKSQASALLFIMPLKASRSIK
jgi:uncharacterized damage-inducible protein DinB